MGKTLLPMVLACILFASGVLADEPSSSALMLNDGANDITLTLVNAWNRDITDLTAHIDGEQLPDWLRLTDAGEPVTITTTDDGACELHLQFTVTPFTSSTTGEFDMTFADNAGNCWTVPLSVAVNGSDNAPPVFDTALMTNYPNPFNPATTIPYSLREPAHVEMSIYNSIGQKVRTLVRGPQLAGAHSVRWDGTDEKGRAVSSGTYICRFIAGGFTDSRRMMLIE